ncbi:MAG: YkgJ family cysteine cluster protein [Deltaproteobacteria bacterium]|nr:YkgJ family cysteine cluster protein [Deltaproteobacteria bacterium]
MNEQFKPFFDQYEALSASVERAFESVKNQFPECVKCKPLCSDCCHAVFDLTFIEALYINKRFRNKYNGEALDILTERCNKIDRMLYKLKKSAYKAVESGKEEKDILHEMAETRVRCPMLNDAEMCEIYDFRPLTCKLYGIPTAIGGEGYTCGLSGFEKGEKYPTANLDKIQNKLLQLSADLAVSIQSKYSRLGEMLVPLSMALATDYDDEYLGIQKPDATAAEAAEKITTAEQIHTREGKANG